MGRACWACRWQSAAGSCSRCERSADLAAMVHVPAALPVWRTAGVAWECLPSILCTPSAPPFNPWQALPNMRPGYCALAQSFEFSSAQLAAAAVGQQEGDGSGDAPAAGGASSGGDEQMADAAAGAAEQGGQQQQQQDEGGGTAAAAGGGGDVAGAGTTAAAAALEDRLQECLLEAFATGTGALVNLRTSALQRTEACWSRLGCPLCPHVLPGCTHTAAGAAAAEVAWYHEGLVPTSPAVGCPITASPHCPPPTAPVPLRCHACRGPDAQISGYQVRAKPPVRPLAQAEAVSQPLPGNGQMPLGTARTAAD